MLKKRLIFCASDKGGIGKSMFVTQLTQWLLDKGVRVRGFDPDHSHWRFQRSLPDNVEKLNIEDSHELDECVRCLMGDYDVAVVDGVGAEQVKTEAWIDAVDLFAAAHELGVLITFVLLIEEDMAVLEQAARLITKVGAQVDWVFVKNPKAFKSSDAPFPIWDGSKIREEALSKLSAAEIRVPKIEAADVNFLTQNGGTVKAAIGHETLFILNRNRFAVYWRAFEAAIAGGKPSAKFIKKQGLSDAWKEDGAFFLPINE